MPLTYHKAKSISLDEVDHDERWLQERILEDPSILGLGELTVIERERKQSAGGRIDFLMSDLDTNTMYEVEVMLGRLDESHIIRTIEYWDLERRRRPDRDHRAVIVAEEITNRFFNVISLLNRSVPIIAVQLNAFQIDDRIVLNFTKVLDIYEPPEDEGEEEAEPTDRPWWERRSNPQSLGIVDQCVALLATGGKKPRLTYNKFHIAVGGVRQNFCWFHPRKAQSHCHFHLRTSEANQQSILRELQGAGIDAVARRKDQIRVVVTPVEMRQHETLIRDALSKASEAAGGMA